MKSELCSTAICNNKTIRLKLDDNGLCLVNEQDLNKFVNIPKGTFGDNWPSRNMVNHYLQKHVEKESVYYNIMTSIDLKMGEMMGEIFKWYLNNGRFATLRVVDGRDPFILVNSLAAFLGVETFALLEDVEQTNVKKYKYGVLQFVYFYDVSYLLLKRGYEIPEEIQELTDMGKRWYQVFLKNYYETKATPIIVNEANVCYVERNGVIYWRLLDLLDEKEKENKFMPTLTAPCVIDHEGLAFVRMKDLKKILRTDEYRQFVDSMQRVIDTTDDEEEADFYRNIMIIETEFANNEEKEEPSVVVSGEDTQEAPMPIPMPSPKLKYEAPDMVHNPPHYTSGGIEVIDILKAKLTPEEFKGFCKGNALKYLFRGELKGKELEDYEKAQWYLTRLIEVTKGE